jgi:hypothetical protein
VTEEDFIQPPSKSPGVDPACQTLEAGQVSTGTSSSSSRACAGEELSPTSAQTAQNRLGSPCCCQEKLLDLVSGLCSKVERLEAETKQQRRLLEQLLAAGSSPGPSSSPGPATTPLGASGPKVTSKSAPASNSSNFSLPPGPEKVIPKKIQSGKKYDASSDVKETQHDDFSKRTIFDATKKNKRFSKGDLPHCLIIHDSMLNKLDTHRMGVDRGLFVATRRAYTIPECREALHEAKEEIEPEPECIVLHVGFNDIKGKDPSDCCEDFSELITLAKDLFPEAKIIVSEALPVKDKTLNRRREMLNANIKASLLGKDFGDEIRFFSSEFASQARKRLTERDNIHPTAECLRILSRKLGAFLHGLFYEQPRRRHTQRPAPVSQSDRAPGSSGYTPLGRRSQPGFSGQSRHAAFHARHHARRPPVYHPPPGHAHRTMASFPYSYGPPSSPYELPFTSPWSHAATSAGDEVFYQPAWAF